MPARRIDALLDVDEEVQRGRKDDDEEASQPPPTGPTSLTRSHAPSLSIGKMRLRRFCGRTTLPSGKSAVLPDCLIRSCNDGNLDCSCRTAEGYWASRRWYSAGTGPSCIRRRNAVGSVGGQTVAGCVGSEE